MRVQPVIAHADAEADGHPVEDGGDEQVGPAEREQGRDRLHVKPDQHDAGQPIQFGISRLLEHGDDAAQLGLLVEDGHQYRSKPSTRRL